MGRPSASGCGLSKDTTQFDFTGACWLSLRSAGAPFQLGAHHRQLCTIHFDIQNRDGRAQNTGELQLHDAIAFGLFSSGDIGPNGFGVTFDSFDGDFQSSQQMQLFAAFAEARLASYGGQHTSHAGRALRLDYVQFPVARALSLMATWAAVIGALIDHGTQHGQDLLAAWFVIPRLLTAATGNVVGQRTRHAQQPLQGHCPGPMHRLPHQHLDGLQIDRARLMPIAEDNLQDSVYFLGDFLLDRFRRFFSCGVRVSSTGRSLQIFSLTSSRS